MADNGSAARAPEAAADGQPPVVKTEKQLKKEAQKNAKLAKYNEKMAKQKVQGAEEVKARPHHTSSWWYSLLFHMHSECLITSRMLEHYGASVSEVDRSQHFQPASAGLTLSQSDAG